MLIFLLSLLAADATPRPPSPKVQAAIKRHAETKLKDAVSAQWKWPAAQGEGKFYCGWINAKNSFGAYVGWTPYAAIIEKDVVTLFRVFGSNAVADDAFKSSCEAQGYNLSAIPEG